LQLRPGEKLIFKLTPHPFSFLDLYLLALYMAALGYLFTFQQKLILSYIPQQILDLLTPLNQYLGMLSPILILWIAVTVLPFLIAAILKIRWRWFFFALAVVAIGLAVKYYFNYPENFIYLPQLAIGILGITAVDLFRRGHKFYITDQRIITELKFLSHHIREVSLTRISDLVLIKPFLGRIFNYGTIIPITPSGFGLGEDFSAVAGTTGAKGASVTVAGGRTVSVPRGRSSYVLFGVKNPDKIYNELSLLTRRQEETYYLKDISEKIGHFLEKAEEKTE